MSKIIKLTQNKMTIVDNDVYKWASKYKWFASHWKNGFYACRGGKQINKKREANIALHREILNAPKGFMVDHINGNTLDNRKENLRLCSNKQNQQNAKLSKNNSSGYKGVRFHINRNKYICGIRVNKKLIHLGYFKNPIIAAKVYDKAVIKYFGEFALTNKKLGLL